MIEVFRTNVEERCHADAILARIHATFPEYTGSFDLEDCDKVLRIKCSVGQVNVSCLIGIFSDSGYTAEILPDTVHPVGRRFFSHIA